MKFVFAAALLLLGASIGPMQAEEPSHARSASGVGSKAMDSCREDTRKYCATASAAIQKECLVKNWDRISSDCQDAVATPGRGPAGATQ